MTVTADDIRRMRRSVIAIADLEVIAAAKRVAEANPPLYIIGMRELIDAVAARSRALGTDK